VGSSSSSSASGGAVTFNVTYTYDPAGNRLLRVDTASRTSHTYDAANELTLEQAGTSRTSYSYDPCGNRTLKNAFGSITLYTWDAAGRLGQAVPPGAGTAPDPHDPRAGPPKALNRGAQGAHR
jgi:YD repeat-containing protein